MTWLFVPSVSAPASEASTSAFASLDPTRAASLSWRGKPQQPQAWSRAWKRGGFIRLLSGLTCEPSTLQHGAAQWIASCREIPVRETASPESASAPTMTAGCSTGRSKSLIKAGLTPSSGKTSRGTSTASSPSQSRHWKDWAVALRAEYSARLRPKQATGGSDCSSWPTARASDEKGPDPLTRRPEADDDLPTRAARWPSPRTSDTNGPGLHGDGGPDLRTVAAQWPTPEAGQFGTADVNRLLERRTKYQEKYGNNGFGLTLGQTVAVMEARGMWPTPAGSEPRQGYQRRPEGMASEQNQQSLTTVAVDFQSSPQAPPTNAGQTSSPERRTLNPLFVEWLMGWPTGLSGFDTAGTASCRSPLPSPGCDCTHCWLSRQREALMQLLAIEPPAQAVLL